MSLGHPELGPSSAAASVGERHLRSDEARCQSRSTMVHWESTLEFPIHPFFRGLGVMPNSVQGIGRVQTPHLSAASKAQRWGVRVLLVMAFRTREWSKRRPRKMSQTFLFSEIMKVRYSIILRKFLKGKMSGIIIYLTVCLSVCLSIHPSFHASMHPSIHPSIYRSIDLSADLYYIHSM